MSYAQFVVAAVTIYLTTVAFFWFVLDVNIYITIFVAAAVIGFFTALSASWWNGS